MAVSTRDHFFVGKIVHSQCLHELDVITYGFIAVKNGKIIGMGDASSIKNIQEYSLSLGIDSSGVMVLDESQFLIPGFIDCHTHAPQFPNIGLGFSKPLLEWLDKFTFPLEARYSDRAFAKNVYENVVRQTLECGSTTVAYFATIHKDSTLDLAKICCAQGQRALIGKVNMNGAEPSNYRETTDESIRDTKEIVKSILNLKNDLVKPIITPRFALSCDMELMTELAAIAAENDLHIQTHISENTNEIKLVKEVYPNNSSYANVYDEAKLLTNKTILAHGIHLTGQELKLLKERETSIAHCPISNMCLASGSCDVKRLLDAGLTVGLGTDVSGGRSPSIIDVMRSAMDVSLLVNTARKMESCSESETVLTTANVFYLATLGGARALSLHSKVGNFQVGKDFDALVVDMNVPHSRMDQVDMRTLVAPQCQQEKIEQIEQGVEKFILAADERNILKVYVDGRLVIQK